MAVLAVMVEAVISWLKIPGNSPLKGKPSPENVLNEVKMWLDNADKAEQLQGRVDALNKALSSVGETAGLTTASGANKITEAASKATDKYFQNEQKRRGLIRFLAIVFGIIFAFVFQIDTLAILGDLTAQARIMLGSAAPIVGMILSGLAASAGSSFWHDQSARLRGLKSANATVSELMSK
jgi:hypothetical protein